MASPTRWTWVWVNSGSWWWTRRPGMLQSMGSQRVRHDWTTELNWTEALSTTYTAKLFEVNVKLHKILFFVCVFANVIYLQKQKGTFNLTTISLSHLIILLNVLNANILWCRQVPVSIPNCPLIFCTHVYTHTQNTERLNQNLKKSYTETVDVSFKFPVICRFPVCPSSVSLYLLLLLFLLKIIMEETDSFVQ